MFLMNKPFVRELTLLDEHTFITFLIAEIADFFTFVALELSFLRFFYFLFSITT